MLTPRYAASFKKDYKRLQKRGYGMEKLRRVMKCLISGEPLEERLKDHPLRGKYAGARDCHIEPDWVLIYAIVDDELRLLRTGTHTDLFK
ncbi:MAG: type II toxin-antitoxin system YafQ family toxin [Anaerolineales bacterium]|nr:type II toxin-antitoxin system YafQ family toxin [Anaerolineales bacterium]MDP3184800.1 type II toxin-antitoxin system YafQ family toxin [Anaerolineales bacterium]